MARGAGWRARLRRPITLYAVSDGLTVVTVTYSPGPHLDRFLATLSHATERPVRSMMADNGRPTARPKKPCSAIPMPDCCAPAATWATAPRRTGPSPRLVTPDVGVLVVANPDVQWGPRSIDALLERGRTVADGPGSLGPLIRDPDGSVYPSARHLPSLIRGGMHAVVGPFWKSNPWTAEYRQERTEPSERPVGWLSGSCLLLRRAAFDAVGGLRRALFHVHGGRRPG